MTPGIVELLVHEALQFLTLVSKMSLNDLFSEFFCLMFENEKSTIWLSFCSHTLGGVILDDIGSEGINWMIVRIVKVSWQDSFVWFFPLSLIVVVSNETVKTSIKACEVLLSFLNFINSNVGVVNESDAETNVVVFPWALDYS